ncbi:hypothetical protein WJX73_000001 [Symbiochloris irregularis]|uniref:Carbohydrate kinase PfkB domain-containing protein n=1 Tax=Symbiochloris irregularis TaxID=706552 RepID=A0AAW1PIL6_9CHLO
MHRIKALRNDYAVFVSATGCSKMFDLITLGNLCVDVVTPVVEKLPPVEQIKTREHLTELTKQAKDTTLWEVGANCNVLIAAARLGLRPACIGNLGDDVYGRFLVDALEAEGITRVEPLAPGAFEAELQHTLLCFVLVDQSAAHAFCSRYDFGPWPLLPGVESLTPSALQMLRETHTLLLNGFVFDELPARVVLEAARAARKAGAAVFFDPGPRAWTLPPDVLKDVLDVADVVITTQEEALVLTGQADPQAAGWQIVHGRLGAATHTCFVKLGPSGAILCSKASGIAHWQPALQVDVADTLQV